MDLTLKNFFLNVEPENLASSVQQMDSGLTILRNEKKSFVLSLSVSCKENLKLSCTCAADNYCIEL